MIERLLLIGLGIAGLIGAYHGARKEGWFRVVGEFPFLFSAFWLGLGSLALVAVGALGAWV
jgi:hypothetical protein